MEQDKKLIFDAFVHLFMLMMDGETDNMDLTFDFNRFKAKFKVELTELTQKDEVKGV